LVEGLEVPSRRLALEILEELGVEELARGYVVEDGAVISCEASCVGLSRLLVLCTLCTQLPEQRTLKKYRSRPRLVLGALLSLVDSWPIMTMAMQIIDASVKSMGVRMHANRPTLPMFAVVWWKSMLVEVETRVRSMWWTSNARCGCGSPTETERGMTGKQGG
jgi:hypothetical protein